LVTRGNLAKPTPGWASKALKTRGRGQPHEGDQPPSEGDHISGETTRWGHRRVGTL